MSPLEIWCNESQERYVMAVPAARLEMFRQLCERERCPFAVVGEATEEKRLVLEDAHFQNRPIDLPLEVLLGKPPRMHRTDTTLVRPRHPLDLGPLTTLTNLGKLPYVRMALVWGGYALLLVAIFWLTHGGFQKVMGWFK
jgi:hypothetical protein